MTNFSNSVYAEFDKILRQDSVEYNGTILRYRSAYCSICNMEHLVDKETVLSMYETVKAYSENLNSVMGTFLIETEYLTNVDRRTYLSELFKKYKLGNSKRNPFIYFFTGQDGTLRLDSKALKIALDRIAMQEETGNSLFTATSVIKSVLRFMYNYVRCEELNGVLYGNNTCSLIGSRRDVPLKQKDSLSNEDIRGELTLIKTQFKGNIRVNDTNKTKFAPKFSTNGGIYKWSTCSMLPNKYISSLFYGNDFDIYYMEVDLLLEVILYALAKNIGFMAAKADISNRQLHNGLLYSDMHIEKENEQLRYLFDGLYPNFNGELAQWVEMRGNEEDIVRDVYQDIIGVRAEAIIGYLVTLIKAELNEVGKVSKEEGICAVNPCGLCVKVKKGADLKEYLPSYSEYFKKANSFSVHTLINDTY